MSNYLYLTKEQAAALAKLLATYKLDEYPGVVSVIIEQVAPSSTLEIEFEPERGDWVCWQIPPQGAAYPVRER